MTTKRKAELQRKLSMAPLPKPPDGLLDRIKRDIPEDLGMARDRFSRFNKLSLGVAASVLVLVGGAFFAVKMLSEMEARKEPAAAVTMAPPVAAPAVLGDSKDTSSALPAAGRRDSGRLNEVAQARLEKKDQPRRALGIAQSAPTAAPPPPPPAVAAAGDVVTTAEAPIVAIDGLTERAKVEERESAAPAAEPARAMAKSVVAQNMVVSRPQLFGISVDHQAFDRIKSAIESGERPAASAADVAELVNYFAGPQARVRRDVALDVEASSRPVPDHSSTAFVRVSVDTAKTIRDVKLEIAFDPLAVAAHRRIGDDDLTSATEPIIAADRSVTALYEVTLRPNVRARQAVATATLTYRAPNGRVETLSSWVSYSEAAGSWNRRSRRHRLATLGAIWGETLRASAAGTDIAVKAEELSKQEPRDEKAKELATLATASSRLRSSSPTGSGR